MDKSVQESFGNQLRVRVCGLCWQGDRLLLVNHSGLRTGPFWAPPGGGMEFGLSAGENLVREFREETGLIISVGRLAFVTEYLETPLHAMELFYEVDVVDGSLAAGSDPELTGSKQIIQGVRYMTMDEIDSMAPESKHGVFGMVPTSRQIRELAGYFRI